MAGVCGVLAEFFGFSVFWFRLAFLIVLLPDDVPGLGLYLLLWLIIPTPPYLPLYHGNSH